MKLRLLSIFLAFAAMLVLAACGGSKAATFDVEMNEFAFKPNTFTVAAGAPVTLNLKNSGTLEHSFIIMQQGKDASVPFNEDDTANVFWEQKLPAQETNTFQFTAPTEPGTYEVVCGIPGHLEQGMKGTLTVTP
jgi:uncharacterized cupredoxin-like copper-binding protein